MRFPILISFLLLLLSLPPTHAFGDFLLGVGNFFKDAAVGGQELFGAGYQAVCEGIGHCKRDNPGSPAEQPQPPVEQQQTPPPPPPAEVQPAQDAPAPTVETAPRSEILESSEEATKKEETELKTADVPEKLKKAPKRLKRAPKTKLGEKKPPVKFEKKPAVVVDNKKKVKSTVSKKEVALKNTNTEKQQETVKVEDPKPEKVEEPKPEKVEEQKPVIPATEEKKVISQPTEGQNQGESSAQASKQDKKGAQTVIAEQKQNKETAKTTEQTETGTQTGTGEQAPVATNTEVNQDSTKVEGQITKVEETKKPEEYPTEKAETKSEEKTEEKTEENKEKNAQKSDISEAEKNKNEQEKTSENTDSKVSLPLGWESVYGVKSNGKCDAEQLAKELAAYDAKHGKKLNWQAPSAKEPKKPEDSTKPEEKLEQAALQVNADNKQINKEAPIPDNQITSSQQGQQNGNAAEQSETIQAQSQQDNAAYSATASTITAPSAAAVVAPLAAAVVSESVPSKAVAPASVSGSENTVDQPQIFSPAAAPASVLAPAPAVSQAPAPAPAVSQAPAPASVPVSAPAPALVPTQVKVPAKIKAPTQSPAHVPAPVSPSASETTSEIQSQESHVLSNIAPVAPQKIEQEAAQDVSETVPQVQEPAPEPSFSLPPVFFQIKEFFGHIHTTIIKNILQLPDIEFQLPGFGFQPNGQIICNVCNVDGLLNINEMLRGAFTGAFHGTLDLLATFNSNEKIELFGSALGVGPFSIEPSVYLRRNKEHTPDQNFNVPNLKWNFDNLVFDPRAILVETDKWVESQGLIVILRLRAKLGLTLFSLNVGVKVVGSKEIEVGVAFGGGQLVGDESSIQSWTHISMQKP